jgi:hypothetical protein
MNKRGQVTIFIILAIIIIGVIVAFFALRNSGTLSPNSELKVNQVQDYVQDCLEQEAVELVYEVAENGGYYITPEDMYQTSTGIPIYYDSTSNKSFMPPLEAIEQQIEFYLNSKVFFCTNDFQNFPDLEIKQNLNLVDSRVKIQDENIEIDLKYPITISKGDNTVQIEEFSYTIRDVRLGIVHQAVEEIIEQQIEAGNSICLSCLIETTFNYDVYVNMFDLDETTTAFFIKDENSAFGDKENLLFIFANKYYLEENEI